MQKCTCGNLKHKDAVRCRSCWKQWRKSGATGRKADSGHTSPSSTAHLSFEVEDYWNTALAHRQIKNQWGVI